MKNILALLTALVLNGCSNYPHELTPTSDTTFTYWAQAIRDGVFLSDDTVRSKDNPEAETKRIEKLEVLLNQHKMCDSGYDIKTRRETLQQDGTSTKLHDIFRIYYIGECK